MSKLRSPQVLCCACAANTLSLNQLTSPENITSGLQRLPERRIRPGSVMRKTKGGSHQVHTARACWRNGDYHGSPRYWQMRKLIKKLAMMCERYSFQRCKTRPQKMHFRKARNWKRLTSAAHGLLKVQIGSSEESIM